MSKDTTLKTVDLAPGGSTDSSKLSIEFGGKVAIVIDLKTGDVDLSEELTVNQSAQMFWQAIHEFTRPNPGATIPLADKPKLLKLDVELPKGVKRVETGSLQFNKDWPGIFIRGDNAMWYASETITGQPRSI